MDVEQALAFLLPTGQPEDRKDALLAALAESWDRRRRNSESGGAIIAALVDAEDGGMTYRDVSAATGIPIGTLHRWGARPGSGEAVVPGQAEPLE